MQVVGPTVRAFGMCVDATLTGICELLSEARDMLLIPHIPDAVTKLARLFHAMPDLASSLLTHFGAATNLKHVPAPWAKRLSLGFSR